jgi:hypothetical protein
MLTSPPAATAGQSCASFHDTAQAIPPYLSSAGPGSGRHSYLAPGTPRSPRQLPPAASPAAHRPLIHLQAGRGAGDTMLGAPPASHAKFSRVAATISGATSDPHPPGPGAAPPATPHRSRKTDRPPRRRRRVHQNLRQLRRQHTHLGRPRRPLVIALRVPINILHPDRPRHHHLRPRDHHHQLKPSLQHAVMPQFRRRHRQPLAGDTSRTEPRVRNRFLSSNPAAIAAPRRHRPPYTLRRTASWSRASAGRHVHWQLAQRHVTGPRYSTSPP